MPLNVFVLCGPPGDPTVKRVVTNADVQAQLDPFFTALENSFREGIADEIDFDGRWKPDRDQLLVLSITPEAALIFDQLNNSPSSIESISPSGFENEEIRALAIVRSASSGSRVLLQAFSSQQRLSRKFALIENGNTFNKLSKTVFAIDSQIHIVIESNKIKFKTFNMAKRILDLASVYDEATDQDIKDICGLPRVNGDPSAIIEVANSTIRKLISAVKCSNVLTDYTANSIRTKAALVNIDIPVQGHKINLSSDRSELKKVLTFLDHGVYLSPVSNARYITNSRRVLP